MRIVLGLMALVGVLACGGSKPEGESAEVAAAPVADVATAAAPLEDHATHLRLGIVYSGNLMGELEPCG